MSQTKQQRNSCPWCSESISREEDTTTIGPPPRSSVGTQQWDLHDSCAGEWEAFADQLSRLAKIGAHPTLIEYPKNNGTDELIEEKQLLHDQ
ncbi:hypothetical protein GS429_07215 [Natronorubrum sp. JWXQ-INN-674]|uniref:Uncharacterized protein n=1 Tax=Natronorubrum halalkaliphilum TaxID=2691917 RepID=A0A6B0VL67_9EURY|nr:hypothetical protein [Natronorubrum halalkaliphilum]MXV61857.1 hypothetical protein [Natronorubrum halalkaliphilum]